MPVEIAGFLSPLERVVRLGVYKSRPNGSSRQRPDPGSTSADNLVCPVAGVSCRSRGEIMDENYTSHVIELVNKSEITRVVNSYFRALDEKNFDADHYATIFTTEAKVTRPDGSSLTGPKEIST